MDRKDRKLARELFKLAVIGVFCVMVLSLTLGCAAIPLTHDQCNATKYATAAEHEQCLRAAAEYEQEQHEREDRRLIKRDKLIIFLNACDRSDDLVVFERIYMRSCLPTQRQKNDAMEEYGYKYTHDNVLQCANRLQVQCVDPADIMRALGY